MKRRSNFKARAKPRPASPRPAAGHPFDVTIEKLIYGGDGLARHDGATVFVPFVLPSERVTVEPIERKKDFVRARLLRVASPSPERVEPLCPHFGVCGGCDYQHMDYGAQLRSKAEILREALRRTGKIDWTGEIRTHASEPWKYRNRAQWKVRPAVEANGAGIETAGASSMEIGYFRAQSASLCAVHDCPILSPLLLTVLLTLRDAVTAGSLPRELREIEAFTNEAPGVAEPRVLLTFTVSGFPSRVAEHAKTIQSLLPNIASVLFHDPHQGRMELFGPGFLDYRAAGRKYRVGHFSFFQVNRYLADELTHEVIANESGGLALDLFAGVGLFALPLADTFDKVIAVESNPAAARDLEINATGKGGVEIRNADVEEFLRRFSTTPDLVVVDPPRAGLTPEIVQRLTQISPSRITYVSCEPPTLARDLRAFLQSAYEISRIDLFDLFPQSFHMETVVRLSRRP